MKTIDFFAALLFILLAGCAGLTVINPNDKNENAGTLAVDMKDGKLQLVGTYTCNLDSMGNRFSAVGKTEDDTRNEVLARCQDRTLLSFCKAENIKCLKN